MNSYTRSQQQALSAVLSFLADPEQGQFILTGAPGTGKTFLVKEIIRNWGGEYALCATTHKAARILTENCADLGVEAVTVHSLLNLTLSFDNATLTRKLRKRNRDSIPTDKLIIIDESSMITWEVYNELLKGTCRCKLLFVGDRNQLPPVKGKFSVFNMGDIPRAELTEPVRFGQNQELADLSCELRKWVQDRNYVPAIKHIPGKVELLTERDDIAALIKDSFSGEDKLEHRVATYTNRQAIRYNNYIRTRVRGREEDLVPGDMLVSAQSGRSLHSEDVVRLLSISERKKFPEFPGFTETFTYRDVEVVNTFTGEKVTGILPDDISHFKNKVLKAARASGNTDVVKLIDQRALDLRPADACTVHKLQGSTVDTVYVDLRDIGTCTNKDVMARLVYVAATRARERVVFIGKITG